MTVEDDLRSSLRRVADDVLPPRPDPDGHVARAHRVRRLRRLAAAGVLTAAVVAVGAPRTGLLQSHREEPAHPRHAPVRLDDVHEYTTIDPGAYVAGFEGGVAGHPDVVIDVPPGFSSNGWLYDGTGDGPGTSASGDSQRQLAFWTVASVDTTPCRGTDTWISAGTTTQDLVDALGRVRGLRLTTAGPVTLDGYHGWRVQVRPPSRKVWDACVIGQLNVWRVGTWSGASMMFLVPTQRWVHDLWILDVQGSRVVISADHVQGLAADRVAELEGIVSSARFEVS